MVPLGIGERFRLFFYSTGNIVGSLLAIGGLGLFLGGVIHSYWLAIVAGLYGVGVFGWPRSFLQNKFSEKPVFRS